MSHNSVGVPSVLSGTSGRDEETKKLEKTLRAYYKLCAEKENRKRILADASVLTMLTQFLKDTRPPVMKYIVEILLKLTEEKDDAVFLAAREGLPQAVGAAQEGPFSPNIVKQLMIVASRLQTIEKKKITPLEDLDQRRFFPRTNRQIIFEVEDLSDKLRALIENSCINRLGRRGLISVHCDIGKSRVILRTTQALEAKEVSEILFDCGCELVTQLLKIDGAEERFPMYASERERRLETTSLALPDYLEDNVGNFDPSSTLVTKDHAQRSGWLSSVTNYVKWW